MSTETIDDVELCEYCGEEFRVDVLEYWPDDRAFMLETCCEAVQEFATAAMEGWTRKQWRAYWADQLGEPIRTVITGGNVSGSWTVDHGLELVPVKWSDAKAFVGEHHRHNRPPAGWKFGLGCANGPDLIAVATVGRPVSRMIQKAEPGTVEVNRLTVDDSIEPGLVWNACSMLYGAAAREAETRGFRKVITYTLHGVEDGTSLKAAGFVLEHTGKGGSWDRKGRPRTDSAPTVRKDRWVKHLDPDGYAAKQAAAVDRARRKADRDAARGVRDSRMPNEGGLTGRAVGPNI